MGDLPFPACLRGVFCTFRFPHGSGQYDQHDDEHGLSAADRYGFVYYGGLRHHGRHLRAAQRVRLRLAGQPRAPAADAPDLRHARRLGARGRDDLPLGQSRDPGPGRGSELPPFLQGVSVPGADQPRHGLRHGTDRVFVHVQPFSDDGAPARRRGADRPAGRRGRQRGLHAADAFLYEKALRHGSPRG